MCQDDGQGVRSDVFHRHGAVTGQEVEGGARESSHEGELCTAVNSHPLARSDLVLWCPPAICISLFRFGMKIRSVRYCIGIGEPNRMPLSSIRCSTSASSQPAPPYMFELSMGYTGTQGAVTTVRADVGTSRPRGEGGTWDGSYGTKSSGVEAMGFHVSARQRRKRN